MKKGIRKRFLSIFLCLVLCLTLLPAAATAEAADYNAQFSSAEGSEIYTNTGTSMVSDGPTEDTVFTLTQETRITAVWTYHWNAGSVNPSEQTIKLINTETPAEVYSGSACAGAGSGQENVNWYVFPDVVLQPGTYKVADSHNETWSYIPAANNKGMCTVKGYTGTFYEFNTPQAITQNGVTATVTFDKTSPQDANTSVTATVTLTGTAAAAGTHTVNLTSTKASLNGTAQTATVTAGQDLTTTPVTKTFSFTMPEKAVDDLVLLHTFDSNTGEETVTDLAIEDAICPINGAAPVTEIAETEEYTGTIAWTDSPDSFAPGTEYTATITLTAKEGYTFAGLFANAFTIPGAKSVTSGAGSGTITAVFQSPPEGYITDGSGFAAYRISGGGFDIMNTYQGVWMGTTYGNGGYGTRYRRDNGAPVDVSAVGQLVDMGDGITLTVQPAFSIDGKFINVVYTLKNTGSTDATVSVGSHADIQIAGDDEAPITKFSDGRGFKMVNRSNNDLQFNFFGKGTLGVTDVDTFWFGYYGDSKDNVFTQVEADSYSDDDSGMAYSWVNRVIPASETRVFRTTMGTGDAASGTNVPIGVNFDTQGGSEVAPIAVSSAGSTISAPAAPTRSGYQFSGWYTEAECIHAFDFSTPITATITLYAKWVPNTPGGGGSYTAYYTLTFDTNGGSTISSVRRAEYTTIDLTLSGYVPTRVDYEFTGWYSDAGLTNKIASIRLTGNTTIYAGWDKKVNPNTGGENPFTDVSENDWFFEDVINVYYMELMKGTSVTTFSPNLTTTRSMIVTILYRLENEPSVSGKCPFSDVKSGSYYENAITWAAANGIVGGYGEGKFGPDDNITREQMAAILYRYAQYKGYDVSDKADLGKFTDSGKIGAWAADAMAWANANALVNGVSATILNPQGEATRAQVAAILHRFCENVK